MRFQRQLVSTTAFINKGAEPEASARVSAPQYQLSGNPSMAPSTGGATDALETRWTTEGRAGCLEERPRARQLRLEPLCAICAAHRRCALSLCGQQLTDFLEQPGLAGYLQFDAFEGVRRVFGEKVSGVHAGHC
jgi:hypothetical protein